MAWRQWMLMGLMGCGVAASAEDAIDGAQIGGAVRLAGAVAVAAGDPAAPAGPGAPTGDPARPAVFDEPLAQRLGADSHGMRRYVLVVLKSGPTPLPAGTERDAMFKGHFANMKRLAAEGKLAVAGPLDGVDGWRGVFVLAVDNIDDARALVATDPVVRQGEMVAEYHRFYASAALAGVNDVHARIAKEPF